MPRSNTNPAFTRPLSWMFHSMAMGRKAKSMSTRAHRMLCAIVALGTMFLLMLDNMSWLVPKSSGKTFPFLINLPCPARFVQNLIVEVGRRRALKQDKEKVEYGKHPGDNKTPTNNPSVGLDCRDAQETVCDRTSDESGHGRIEGLIQEPRLKSNILSTDEVSFPFFARVDDSPEGNSGMGSVNKLWKCMFSVLFIQGGKKMMNDEKLTTAANINQSSTDTRLTVKILATPRREMTIQTRTRNVMVRMNNRCPRGSISGIMVI